MCGRIPAIITVIVVMALPSSSIGGDTQIDWSTIDGGGEILMRDPSGSTSWEVSGTLGQWDSTRAEGSKAATWEVTGGFWSLSVNQTDHLFTDGFEGG